MEKTLSDPVNGNKISQLPQTSNGTTGSYIRSAEATFRQLVKDIIVFDKKFTGMASYIQTISFFWSNQIKTACAGHGFIFFNPDFWNSLDEDQQKSVVAHEIWHLILRHLDRGKGYDQNSYNIAADHVINLTLKAEGFVMGEDIKFGHMYPFCDDKYDSMSTDSVYRLVHEDRKQGGFGAPSTPDGTPSRDQIEDLIKQVVAGDPKTADVKEQAEKNEQTLQEAIDKSPGSDNEYVDTVLSALQQKVFVQNATYEQIFEKYLTDPLSGGKRTFVRPSRRQKRGDPRLKGKFPKRGKENRLTHLVYALDVSGSITAAQAVMFLSSAKTLKEKLKPKQMTIILWDTMIKFEKTFGEHEELNHIHVKGGGGTRLDPVYQRVAEIKPEALVIFTDLEVIIPPKPEWETIWLVSDQPGVDYINKVTYGPVYMIPEAIT